jgi:hypothetical protein
MMLCVYIEVVRVANDHLNCVEVEVGLPWLGLWLLLPITHTQCSLLAGAPIKAIRMKLFFAVVEGVFISLVYG